VGSEMCIRDRISRGDKAITASGVSEDIVTASVYALINGVNRLYE